MGLTAVVSLINCLISANVNVNLSNLLTIITGPTPGCVSCLTNVLDYNHLHALIVNLNVLNIADLCVKLGLGNINLTTILTTGLGGFNLNPITDATLIINLLVCLHNAGVPLTII